ncbi:MAG: helix-turn-helix domain-containing protein [Ktedonobacteraceae bacterium]
MSERDFDAITFGRELRSHRKALGWTARQLALVYSEEIGREDTPIDPSFIYHLEAGETLMDKGRRAILARIVDMPLALAGIATIGSQSTTQLFSSPHVDMTEYEATLQAYTGTWQAGTTYRVAKDIKRRVAALENAALYSAGNRSNVIRLLGEYQVLAADVVSEQDPQAASALLGKTVTISYQEKQYNLYVHALRQRAQTGISQFELSSDQSVLTQSLADFQATDAVKGVSKFYEGLVNIRKGLVYAYTARDAGEFTAALNIIDSAGNQIGQVPADPHVAARLDVERWRLNRASAYLYAPLGSPTLALAELEEL